MGGYELTGRRGTVSLHGAAPAAPLRCSQWRSAKSHGARYYFCPRDRTKPIVSLRSLGRRMPSPDWRPCPRPTCRAGSEWPPPSRLWLHQGGRAGPPAGQPQPKAPGDPHTRVAQGAEGPPRNVSFCRLFFHQIAHCLAQALGGARNQSGDL